MYFFVYTRWQTRKSRADKTCQFWHALQRKRELLYHEYRPLENMPILASRVIGRWRVLASAPRCDLPNLENYRIPYFYKLRAYLHEILLCTEVEGYIHDYRVWKHGIYVSNVRAGTICQLKSNGGMRLRC